MSDQNRICIFNVDDHPLLNEGIAALINNQPDMELVAQAASGSEAIEKFRQHHPDVTLMDLRLPDMSGIDVLSKMLGEFEDVRALMLTTAEGDAEIQRALQAGARGYLLKSMPNDQIVSVIRSVHAGRRHVPTEVAARLAEHLGEQGLTARELDVLRLIRDGRRRWIYPVQRTALERRYSAVISCWAAVPRIVTSPSTVRSAMLHSLPQMSRVFRNPVFSLDSNIRCEDFSPFLLPLM